MTVSYKRIFIYIALFFSYKLLWLGYSVAVPFTNDPADFVLLGGMGMLILALPIKRGLISAALSRPFSKMLAPLIIFLIINISMAVSEQGVRLTFLSNRGWLYIIFLFVGYLIITPNFRLNDLIEVFRKFSFFASLSALFYSLTANPGDVTRLYFPLVSNLTAIFLIFNFLVYAQTKKTSALYHVLLHVIVSILSFSRSWWVTIVLISCIAFLGMGKGSTKTFVRLSGVSLFVLAALLLLTETDEGKRAESLFVDRYESGLENIATNTGTYQHRLLMLMDAYDYVTDHPDKMTMFLGIGMLHSDSALSRSLIGRGRSFGYTGRGALFECAYANYLLGGGFLGLALIMSTYILFSVYIFRYGSRKQTLNLETNVFLVCVGAYYLAYMAAMFFAANIEGAALGLLLLVAGALKKEKFLADAAKKHEEPAGVDPNLRVLPI